MKKIRNLFTREKQQKKRTFCQKSILIWIIVSLHGKQVKTHVRYRVLSSYQCRTVQQQIIFHSNRRDISSCRTDCGRQKTQSNSSEHKHVYRAYVCKTREPMHDLFNSNDSFVVKEIIDHLSTIQIEIIAQIMN